MITGKENQGFYREEKITVLSYVLNDKVSKNYNQFHDVKNNQENVLTLLSLPCLMIEKKI